jgi:glycine oxidase
VHVLVLGAGIVGVAVADALAQRGARVTVLDMRVPGRGASYASAGILAPYTEAHHDSPLLPLATRSLDMFDDFVSGVAARSGRTIEYARSGTLEVALGDVDVARLKAASTWLASIGITHEWLDSAGVRAFEPATTSSAVAGLLVPGHGFVGVASLLSALTHSARLAGAVFEAPVEATDIDAVRDHVVVRAGARRYTADSVVVATGTWSQRVRVKGARPIPVRPIRGQLLHLRWPAKPPARVVWGPRCYTVPWRDGSVLVGATVEDVGFDERSTVAGVHDLTAAVAELLPASLQASIEDVRVGLRPATSDGLPVIGASTVDPRITIATGHYRNGILLAPLTAAVVARRVLDGVDDPVLAVTRADRFAGST